MNKFRFFESHPWRGVVAIAALLLTGLAQAGPISALYLAESGYVGGYSISVLQGNNQINTWAPVYEGELTMAIDSTVRTYAQGDPVTGLQSSEYLLDGTPTGVTYTNTVGCCFRDGATDGTYNYATSRGKLYQFNSDWTNPQLYNLTPGASGGHINGVAYDAVTDSFWLSYYDQGSLSFIANLGRPQSQNTNPLHNVLNYFRADTEGRSAALAFDPIDRTLWMTSYAGYDNINLNSITTLQQYSTEPHPPGVIQIRTPLSSQQLGGGFTAAEFALRPGAVVGDPRGSVPEPASVVLFITGLLGMNLFRQKRETYGAIAFS